MNVIDLQPGHEFPSEVGVRAQILGHLEGAPSLRDHCWREPEVAARGRLQGAAHGALWHAKRGSELRADDDFVIGLREGCARHWRQDVTCLNRQWGHVDIVRAQGLRDGSRRSTACMRFGHFALDRLVQFVAKECARVMSCPTKHFQWYSHSP